MFIEVFAPLIKRKKDRPLKPVLSGRWIGERRLLKKLSRDVAARFRRVSVADHL